MDWDKRSQERETWSSRNLWRVRAQGQKNYISFESTLLLSTVCSSVVCVMVVGQIFCNQPKRLFRLWVYRRAAASFVLKLGNNSKWCMWDVLTSVTFPLVFFFFFCSFNCFMAIPFLQKYIFKRFLRTLRTLSVKMRRIYLAV